MSGWTRKLEEEPSKVYSAIQYISAHKNKSIYNRKQVRPYFTFVGYVESYGHECTIGTSKNGHGWTMVHSPPQIMKWAWVWIVKLNLYLDFWKGNSLIRSASSWKRAILKREQFSFICQIKENVLLKCILVNNNSQITVYQSPNKSLYK